MTPDIQKDRSRPDICVIGAGSAGLSVAAGAVQMGARIVLIEKGLMGGDCLNYGCVPSKSLLHAAKSLHHFRKTADKFHIPLPSSLREAGFSNAMQEVQASIETIAPHDSQERFESLGVKVLREAAHFIDRQSVQAGPHIIKARRFVVATGSRPALPDIPGLDTIPFYTNESLFQMTALPNRMLIVGGGPIGCEMAQAFARLGSAVTLVQNRDLLAHSDSVLRQRLQSILRDEGVNILTHSAVRRFSRTNQGIEADIEIEGDKQSWQGEGVLIATGRHVNCDNLDLEKADVDYTADGICVNASLRTTNKRVYAAGDVAGRPFFTHKSSLHASVILKQVLFRLPAKAELSAFPTVIYTDPELAGVGCREQEAKQAHQDIKVIEESFQSNDRAITENSTTGQIRLFATQSGKVLGVSLLGPMAGEIIQPWCLVMKNNLKLSKVAGTTLPYPTMGEINKKAAGAFYAPRLFSSFTKKVVRFLSLFG